MCTSILGAHTYYCVISVMGYRLHVKVPFAIGIIIYTVSTFTLSGMQEQFIIQYSACSVWWQCQVIIPCQLMHDLRCLHITVNSESVKLLYHSDV